MRTGTILLLTSLAACGTSRPPDAGGDGGTADGGAGGSDVTPDAGTGSSIDAGSNDAGGGGSADGGTSVLGDAGEGDAGSDQPVDAGGSPMPVSCQSAGGTCVQDPCSPPSTVGDPSLYACSGGPGVECCLPPPGPVTCQSAGGQCVALYPGSCPPPSTIGDASQYTCGGGLGTECCLPGAGGSAPVCAHQGTSDEGWYGADGTLICKVSCATASAPKCELDGSSQASKGWYTSSGHGCPPYSRLIVHDESCTP